ncbi:FtsQ-type POTRA domain-containing protein [Microbacterium ginsengiterrae]|uniref:FtsQ-type POTRA domain-containing protein n=1 Tax=Microbacterium ginsengiterrae TaxID=546115 RepID=UPI0016227FA5
MRRPPPLPSPPEEAPSIPSRPRREIGVPASPIDLPVDPSGDEDAVAESLGSEDLTARDVWRAARARRRRLRAEIRRFTQRSRRRRLIWLGVLGAVLLTIGGSVLAAYSPLFAVEKITVVGASAVDAAAVESALSDQVGRPLALVDDSEVKAALMAFPLIETYALEAKPPHDLTLRIVERTPVGVIESDAGYTLVDAAGVALATTPERPDGQPVLRVDDGVGSDTFGSVGLVVRSLPADVRGDLVEVTASTLDDVTLSLGSGLTVVWGSADRSVEKAGTLTATMTANPGARTIDVSSPEVVVAG